MNQSAQTSSQDNKEQKKNWQLENSAYEFFQPVFDSNLTYEFASGTPNNGMTQTPTIVTTAMTSSTAMTATNPSIAPLAPLAPLSPLTPLTPIGSKPSTAPLTPVAPVAPVALTAAVSPIAKTAGEETVNLAATVQALPPSVSTLIEAAFSCETSTLQTVESLAEQARSAASVDKQVTDDSGAVISYGRWNIKPHRIRYPDRSVAEFEYDESESRPFA